MDIALECGDVTMDDMDFTCEFYTNPSKVVTVKKEDMIRQSEYVYRAVVDTTTMMGGTISMKVIANIPDSDCPDGIRTEIVTASTKIDIKR